jgi:16S rRNA (guanine527-N7)-methyltransferase
MVLQRGSAGRGYTRDDVTEGGNEVESGAIADVARSLDQDLRESVVAQLVAFAGLFLTWNSRINLGGTLTARVLVERHFRDAFAACRFITAVDSIVDVGSGGGLPIIPMALVRERARFDLYEPTRKKVAFLRTAVRELGLGGRVRIHPSRLEVPIPEEARGRFDLAVSRATFPTRDWLVLGRQLVRPKGRVLVFATAEPASGCPDPSIEFPYATNRRLLLFE